MRVVAIDDLLGVPLIAWIADPRLRVFAFILTKTPFGRHLTMIGGNAAAPFRAGIKVDRLISITFILSGAIAGLAGWLLAIRTAGATANLGVGMLFEAFAAVVIGGVSLKGGFGRLSGRLCRRAAAPARSQTAINSWACRPHYTQIIRGALVLVAVLLDTVNTSIRQRYV